jgi:hypothetical protein
VATPAARAVIPIRAVIPARAAIPAVRAETRIRDSQDPAIRAKTVGLHVKS